MNVPPIIANGTKGLKHLLSSPQMISVFIALMVQLIFTISWAIRQEARITAAELLIVGRGRQLEQMGDRFEKDEERLIQTINRIDRQETPLGRRVDMLEARVNILAERILMLDGRVNELMRRIP